LTGKELKMTTLNYLPLGMSEEDSSASRGKDVLQEAHLNDEAK